MSASARPSARPSEGRALPAATRQTGAQWLLRSAAASGIEVCFANPGTTELPFVGAMDAVPQVRPILCAFEGVCSGAADGYYRIRGVPAMTLTHLGPGFANAIANLHNARRAGSAVYNVIGEHMSWHVEADPPLASDIESLAKPVSAGVYRADSPASLVASVRQSLANALAPHGGIHSLILPMDLQAAAMDEPVFTATWTDAPAAVEAAAIERVAAAVAAGRRTLLLLGGDALHEAALLEALRLRDLANVEIVGETFPARSEHGGGLPAIRRFNPAAEQAHAYLLGFEVVALIGAKRPVAFFGVEGYPSYLGDPARMIALCQEGRGAAATLAALADDLKLARQGLEPRERVTDQGLDETLTPETAARVVAAWLPENAIISAEGKTLAFPFNAISAHAPRHASMVLTGGAIGQGIPAAFGAAIAAPDRKVVGLQSDGSALYTVQALWSMARENADATILIASNRRYNILIDEMRRNGYELASPPVRDLLQLSRPDLDWLGMAAGFGVHAERASTVSELRRSFKRAMAERGPRLIEVMLP
ncbi:acetolactate synthase large subunit [Pigmentiphaga sp. NML080357]|uniref:acetolactate synthase large subunit n=1 Tax=Pigmentiphaga sp. NML080357 TaxID=2008675 RepID=UPI000B4231C9|nr:acetolactate synthase large subunit [Pigmentiphaga sp. NML080357]OVZ54616.1 acetolactate synthase large subunit [Pigmentiphaga sp. NML080357]